MANGGAEVRCRCGAWSPARDDESVACVRCASPVSVAFAVRLYVRLVELPTDDTPCCATCGHSVRETSSRCRWCKSDLTARVRRPSRAIVRDRFPVAVRGARGIFCGACSHALERAPPTGPREFALCAGCGAENHSTHVQSMLAMQRYLAADDADRAVIAALDHADAALREARAPYVPSFLSWVRMLGHVLLFIAVYSGICGVVFALLSSVFVTKPEPQAYVPPPMPRPGWRMPEIVTRPEVGPEECARVGAGACLDDYTLRRCTDAGVVEDETCVWMGFVCMRDACKPGAKCCPFLFDAGARD